MALPYQGISIRLWYARPNLIDIGVVMPRDQESELLCAERCPSLEVRDNVSFNDYQSLTDVSFFQWMGSFIEKQPWAFIALLLILILVVSPAARFSTVRFIRNLKIKNLKVSEFEVAFDAESSKALVQDLQLSISSINIFRKKASKEIQKIVANSGVSEKFISVSSKIFSNQFDDKFGYNNNADDSKRINARATLHINDFVFRTRLYQLLDYYPEGGGAERNFSYRIGIIGRVWRSGLPASAGYLTAAVAPKPLPSRDEQVKTVRLEWGVTTSEALKFQHKPSYCCVPIKADDRILGVFYMDAEIEDFGWTKGDISERLEGLKKECADQIDQSGLTGLLLELETEIAKTAPRMESEF